MKLTYDPQHNIAYIRFHEKSGTVTTLKVSEEMNIDIAPDGTVYEHHVHGKAICAL